MSTGQRSQHDSRSSSSKDSRPRRHTPPLSTFTPENTDPQLEPCAATGSFLLYAQRNLILVLHHDTLAIERRFELHREEIRWITVDNVSERGAGRLAVSFDAGQTAIVWDILTGREVARFAAYDEINVACFMRNGNIAFGNNQGSVILFEPGTSEHISARTIFDPVTALAPSSDCRTFAIGYLNGSILIATLQPAFTILHTLTTSRAPSRIAGLAWHGSSSKQKTDMLATQTADGDLRVWSVPKAAHQESPTIIRALGRSGFQSTHPSWFAWSKNGRILQHFDGETRSWDVRTKKVTYDIIPTIEGVIGVANYGPTATLFTLGHNHTVQQYDVNPAVVPLQVMSVQHVPANTPPTPPTNLEEQHNTYTTSRNHNSHDAMMLPVSTDGESSADEGGAMSPLQKIAREIESLDQLESEIRDKVTPLSPTSSRASSTSSTSSGGGMRQRKYLYDRPAHSRTTTSTGYEGTEFSFGARTPRNHDSMSLRSGSTRASNARYRSSSLRKEILRSPEESKESVVMDLFPCVNSRLQDVAFRTPHYGSMARTPEILQREMLSVVFGWNDDIRALVRDEQSRHRPGSASAVLLAKWLGDMGADNMASMIGSESMTSSDWMLLALSSIGQDSQKKVGEAFVQRLLEKGDVHPAVAILLGLGEHNDAIEVYVSQGYLLEAVLLTCLCSPSDWGRQSHLLRRWGEVAVQSGQPELAVRIFSCTSVETSEPWFSPRAQDAVYTAQQQRLMDPADGGPLTSPPLSPPSRSASGRLTAKNASLKLITSFGVKGAPVNNVVDDPTPLAVGVTPIINSAMSPRPGDASWTRQGGRSMRAPSSARTATPGAYGRKKRLPSTSDIARAKQEAAELMTPITAARNPGSRAPSLAADNRNRRTSSVSDVQAPMTASRPTVHDGGKPDELSSAAMHSFATRAREKSRGRNASRDRNPDNLTVQIIETRFAAHAPSPGPSTHNTSTTGYTTNTEQSRTGQVSPALTGMSTRSAKSKAVDDYINSVEAARSSKRQERAESRARDQNRPRGQSLRRGESRTRAESRAGAPGRARDRSEARSKTGIEHIKPPKASPSSPIPMSPEEIAYATHQEAVVADVENFYKLASPMQSSPTRRLPTSHARHISQDDLAPLRSASRAGRRQRSPDRDLLSVDDGRGRQDMRGPGSAARSPSSPLPMLPDRQIAQEQDDVQSDGRRVRVRAQSSAGRDKDDLQTRRAASRSRVREGSSSHQHKSELGRSMANMPELGNYGTDAQNFAALPPRALSRPQLLSRKELAAKELEDRRLSLARRPSAPAIPLPGELAPPRPSMTPRSNTELGNDPISYMPPLSRSHTADPDMASKYNRSMGTSTPSAPIGLPATPRAMKHPRYMNAEANDRDAPPVPAIPDGLSSLSGSSLSQLTSSNLSQAPPSSPSHVSSYVSSSLVSDKAQTNGEEESIGPLLPSTVFGKQGPQAPRSASAPPEKQGNPLVHPAYKFTLPTSSRRLSGERGHVRKISPPEDLTQEANQHEIISIDQALHGDNEQQVIIIEDSFEVEPVLLPELQHLAMPPPPPPPPGVYQQLQQSNPDMIKIAIDGNDSYTTTSSDLSHAPGSFPYSMERASTTSPTLHHRRDRGSISDSFSSRMRGVADRMRSNSRSRTKSPQTLEAHIFRTPYETVLPPIPSPHQRRDSVNRVKSPYEQAMADQQMMPPPPPPPPAPPAPDADTKFHETAIPPRNQGSGIGYRHPKEIRANMPPDHLQAGAVQGGFL